MVQNLNLPYRGESEEDRREAAILYDRIENLVKRLGMYQFPMTDNDVEALQFCMDCLVFPTGEPLGEEVTDVPGAPITPGPEHTTPPPPSQQPTGGKPVRRIRPVP